MLQIHAPIGGYAVIQYRVWKLTLFLEDPACAADRGDYGFSI
jgi:hypothetical protein